MRANEIRSGALDTARRINERARPTPGILPASICRDYAAFEAARCAQLSENVARAAVPRMKLIISAQMQNYDFPISATHISIAKFGWLRGA
jgi:hypothetical protein